jgi:hypothetical protein
VRQGFMGVVFFFFFFFLRAEGTWGRGGAEG